MNKIEIQNPWRRKWQPDLVFLPGKSHGQKQGMWAHRYVDITHLEIIIGLNNYKGKYKILDTLTLINETQQNKTWDTVKATLRGKFKVTSLL